MRMNPNLLKPLHDPWSNLRRLLAGAQLPKDKPFISLSIGEPRHPTPQVVKDAIVGALQVEGMTCLAHYPPHHGSPRLIEAIAGYLERRYGARLDPATQILQANGSKETLFAFVHTFLDPTTPHPCVILPNPFYGPYEANTVSAGGEPLYLPICADTGFRYDFSLLTERERRDTQMIFVCSPSNPTGHCVTLDEWKEIFEMSDRYGWLVLSDECYSEIYFTDEPPLGALQACRILGRDDFRNVAVFSSLSKRSSVPGLRSGYVAGDAKVIQAFKIYRTHQGVAMNTLTELASIAAWNDEQHVQASRAMYVEKFRTAQPLINRVCQAPMPDASFYLWARTPIDDTVFTRRLYEECGIKVLPGSYLSREVKGFNPGRNFVPMALVATTDEVREAAQRIADWKI